MGTKPRVSSGWGPPSYKPSGRMADYAATKGTLLLGEIQRHMMREADKPSDRRQDIIHPSEMAHTGWCPRSTYFRIKACREASDPFLKPRESVGVQLLNIFDEGHYIHDKWQRRLWDMGLLGGQWKCLFCGGKFNAISPEKCPLRRCSVGKELLQYAEIGLQSPEYLIYGHADGGIPSKKALIEIKSVGAGTVRVANPELYKRFTDGQKIDLPGLWKGIEEPFPDHINQGQIYLALCNMMNLPYERIVFLYESKFSQGAKEFVVDFDIDIASGLLESASAIKSALDGLTDPPECPYDGCTDCEGKDDGTKIEKPGLGTGIPENARAPRTIKRGSGTPRRIVRT